MKRPALAVAVIAVCLAPLAGACSASARQPTGAIRPGAWATAAQLPGVAAVDKGGNAGFEYLACGSAGSCTASGFYYTPAASQPGGFVASEVDGTWQAAQTIPGLARLSHGTEASVGQIGCTGPGDCVAMAGYGASPHFHLVAASQVHGRWRLTGPMPGLAALSQGRQTLSGPLSCDPSGWCATSGMTGSGGAARPWVSTWHAGRWGVARRVPGLAGLSRFGPAILGTVSCAGATCAAGGSYRDQLGHMQPVVVTASHGRWARMRAVQGIGKLADAAAAGRRAITAVSCGVPGNCAAGGYYTDLQRTSRAFVVTERNGTWGLAQNLPGGPPRPGWWTSVAAMSCAGPDDCAAGLGYSKSVQRQGTDQISTVFVATSVKGVWGDAREIPGMAALNRGWAAQISGVSCGAAGDCSAAGYYSNSNQGETAFVVDESDGTWARAIQVRGLGPSAKVAGSDIAALVCTSAAKCTAVGHYVTRGRYLVVHLFVLSRG